MHHRRSVDALLARLPADDPERAQLYARASSYATDCGCTMGAVFMAATALGAVVYFVVAGGLGLWQLGVAVGAVVVATGVGKATGLALAALRLRLLRLSLTRRLRSVHVH